MQLFVINVYALGTMISRRKILTCEIDGVSSHPFTDNTKLSPGRGEAPRQSPVSRGKASAVRTEASISPE
jgi:hypothetical protein